MAEKLVTCGDGSDLKKMELKYDVINDNYVDFIGNVRGKARDGDKLSHGLPILPLEADADPPYICVNLQVGGVDKGVAIIRRYDLRLIYFQDVFGHMINVDDFEIYDKDSGLLDFGIDGFLLGLPMLVKVVDCLANCSKINVRAGTSFLVMCNQKQPTTFQDTFDVRTCLCVLCLALCEATKIDFFSCLFGNAFKSGVNVSLTPWMLHRINDWESFSEELFLEEHADCNFYLPDLSNDWHDEKRVIGVTCLDIAHFLGILRAFPLYDPMPLDCLTGTCLLEVYSVRVYVNDGRSTSVYGSVKIDNGCGTFHIYDRTRSQSEFVQSHGTLSLQDPESSIVVNTNFDIMVDIMEEGGDNLEIIIGKLSWSSSLGSNYYDTRLSTMVRGKNGYAIVNYSVFKNAIQAQLQVALFTKSDDLRDIGIHGGLTTRYGDFDYVDIHKKYFQTTLFGKPFVNEEMPCTYEACKRRGEEAQEGGYLKLARSRVTVPVDSSLMVVANLKSCKGKSIVTDSIEFVPRKFGKVARFIGDFDDSHKPYVHLEWKKIDSISKEE